MLCRYLKWNNDIIGRIDEHCTVTFEKPDYNEVVALYTCGTDVWDRQQFMEFLAERIVSRERRDIEQILFRCGLSAYDVLKIAEITRGIHPKDLLWLSLSEEETLENTVTDIFDSIFIRKTDLQGDSINTPEGFNIKRYGAYNGNYGIYKQRINPLTTDVESEVAVYLLACRLRVPCCPAYRADENSIFSEFKYDFAREYIVHFRRLFSGARSDNEYRNLMQVRPQYRDDYIRMMVLDFITRQDDRHLSNMAIKVSPYGESFYMLYDNGRSLFYEDTEELVKKACEDVILYATSFGYGGTYYDYLKETVDEGVKLAELVNLEITDEEIDGILKTADFKGYRLEGAKRWIRNTIDVLKRM